MRIATNEELLLINGSSQKLSKNQLKKLYDHGGVLTPKDWATMIDNVAQNEIPIIYDNTELYNMMNRKKLIPGKIYYTEYYGELRYNELVNSLSSVQIIALKAISTSEFGRCYDFNGRTFNIEFHKMSKPIQMDEDWYEDRGNAYRVDLEVTLDYRNDNSGEWTNDTFTIPALLIKSPTERETQNIILYTPLRSVYSTRISSNNYDNPYEFHNVCENFSFSIGYEDTVRVVLGSTITDEDWGLDRNISIDDTVDYISLPYIIQLNHIIDSNNNYFEKCDYKTSYINEARVVIADDSVLGHTYSYPCIKNSYNNKIYGNPIIQLDKCNNNIIKSNGAFSIFRARLSNDNTIVHSRVYHGEWQDLTSSGDTKFELLSYLNNCIFNNCHPVLWFNPNNPELDFVNSELINVNNITFDNIPFTSPQVYYYNCIRPINSSNITVSKYKTETAEWGGSWKVIDLN